MPLKIIPRVQWDYAEWVVTRNRKRLGKPASCVFFINTHTNSCHSPDECLYLIRKLRVLHSHVQKLHDIRYNFLVADDGNIYEGRGWNTPPMLPVKYVPYRFFSVLIAFVGPYSESELPLEMTNNAAALVQLGIDQRYIAPNFQYKSLIKTSPQNQAFLSL